MGDRMNNPPRKRRKWMRFPKDEPRVWVWLGGAFQPIECEVVDESFGGISLLIDDLSGLNLGIEVEIEYKSFRMKATARYMRDEPVAGVSRHRVGFEWIPPATPMEKGTASTEELPADYRSSPAFGDA